MRVYACVQRACAYGLYNAFRFIARTHHSRPLSLSPSQEVEGDGDGGASSYDGIDGLCVHVDFNRPALEISPPGYYLSRIITTATIFFFSVFLFFSRS